MSNFFGKFNNKWQQTKFTQDSEKTICFPKLINQSLKAIAYPSAAPTITTLVSDLVTSYSERMSDIERTYSSFNLKAPASIESDLNKLMQEFAVLNSRCTVGQQTFIQGAVRALVLHPILARDEERRRAFRSLLKQYCMTVNNDFKQNCAGSSAAHRTMALSSEIDQSVRKKAMSLLCPLINLGTEDTPLLKIFVNKFFRDPPNIKLQDYGHSISGMETLMRAATEIHTNCLPNQVKPYNHSAEIAKLRNQIPTNIKVHCPGWENNPDLVSLVHKLYFSGQSTGDIRFHNVDDISSYSENLGLVEFTPANSPYPVKLMPIVRGELCTTVFQPFKLTGFDSRVLSWNCLINSKSGLCGAFQYTEADFIQNPADYAEFINTESTTIDNPLLIKGALVFQGTVYTHLLAEQNYQHFTEVVSDFELDDDHYLATVLLDDQRIVPWLDGVGILDVNGNKIQHAEVTEIRPGVITFRMKALSPQGQELQYPTVSLTISAYS